MLLLKRSTNPFFHQFFAKPAKYLQLRHFLGIVFFFENRRIEFKQSLMIYRHMFLFTKRIYGPNGIYTYYTGCVIAEYISPPMCKLKECTFSNIRRTFLVPVKRSGALEILKNVHTLQKKNDSHTKMEFIYLLVLPFAYALLNSHQPFCRFTTCLHFILQTFDCETIQLLYSTKTSTADMCTLPYAQMILLTA